MPDPHNRDLIPGHLIESLIGYATHGIPTGDFLQAVIANDLVEAYARADRFNTLLLPAIAAFIYNEMPSNCWGSRRVYAAWLEMHAANRAGGYDSDPRLAIRRKETASMELQAAVEAARDQRWPVDR